MATATRSWGVHETLLDPQALPPPPLRHALLVSLVALTAILHLGTSGWSEIQNGVEGYYAGAARQMLAGAAARGEPPLFPWLLIASYRLFGLTPAAAHVPGALAAIGSIALTFLMGERLGGYWRGFAAGLFQLCSLGTFILWRIATPEPLFAMLLQASLFCAVCGYQTHQRRAFWFGAFWLCAAFAFLVEGLIAIEVLGGILLLLGVLFRQARLRFRMLFHWLCLLPFVVIVGLWLVWCEMHSPSGFAAALFPSSDPGEAGQTGLAALLLHQFVWWYPAALLIAPGVLFAWRKVLRPHEFDFADALPLCWMLAGFVLLVVPSQRTDVATVLISPAFALWAAVAWERTSAELRIAGLALVAVACVAAAVALQSGSSLGWLAAELTPASAGRRTVPILAGAVGLAALVAAAYFARADRETLAISVASLAMLPLGLAGAETIAQSGPDLSFASAAGLIAPRLGTRGEVIYEGSPASASSLTFYLERQPLFVIEATASSSGKPRADRITAADAVERFGGVEPVYLIVAKDRAPFWQDLLTSRYHIYHQVSTCGGHVVVTN